MSPEERKALLDELESHLSTLEETPASEPDAPDLFQLFSELAALKGEVKRENRQAKEHMEQLRGAFGTLEQSHESLQRALDEQRKSSQSAERANQRALLLALLELRDRIEAGIKTEPPKPAPFALGERQQVWIEANREGQRLILRQLDRLLGQRGVSQIETEGESLDPHLMQAIEIAHDPQQPDGVVVEELRAGFLWNREPLRIAEVKVNRLA